MFIRSMAQRSDEWYVARLGRLTGSVAGDMVATVKKGEAAARRDLRLRLVCERLTGESQEERFVSKEMQGGIDKEPEALGAYEARTGACVLPVGFLEHFDVTNGEMLLSGASPDGQIGGYRGLVEVKCPKSATHYRYVRNKVVPPEYIPQITHYLWLTGAEWCDFVSYDDRFPTALQLFVVRHHRDERAIEAYNLLARIFLRECDDELAAIQAFAAV